MSASSGANKGGTETLAQQVQQAPLMHASEVVQAFARETGKLLVMIPDKVPCALHRCVHHGEADEALFGGLYDQVPGQKEPRLNRARREERDRNASADQ